MSMTREEAIKFAEHAVNMTDIPEVKEFYRLCAAALRPVSRERVERVFPGCDFCKMADFGEFGFEITKYYAKITCALGAWRFPKNEQFLFCPKCGNPLRDEAVEMVMERLEATNEHDAQRVRG